jgi:hypothetical protein
MFCNKSERYFWLAPWGICGPHRPTIDQLLYQCISKRTVNVNRLCLLGGRGSGGGTTSGQRLDDTHQLPYDVLSVNTLLFIPGPASGIFHPRACIRLERILQAGTHASANLLPGSCGHATCSISSSLQVRTPVVSFLQHNTPIQARSCFGHSLCSCTGACCGTTCHSQVSVVSRDVLASNDTSYAEQGACRTAGMHQLY